MQHRIENKSIPHHHPATLLRIAQKDYKTWNEYFADFATDRDKWDTAPSVDKTAFNTLSVTIMQGDHNIYQLIPLN
jgi:hypothetical protein